jgi:hypothetical protein
MDRARVSTTYFFAVEGWMAGSSPATTFADARGLAGAEIGNDPAGKPADFPAVFRPRNRCSQMQNLLLFCVISAIRRATYKLLK